jgi:hypothetical protein
MDQVAMGCSGWNYYLKPAEKGEDGLMYVLQLKEMIVKNYRKSKKKTKDLDLQCLQETRNEKDQKQSYVDLATSLCRGNNNNSFSI